MTSRRGPLLTAQPAEDGIGDVTLTSDIPLEPGVGEDPARWSVEDGGGPRTVTSVTVTGSAITLGLSLGQPTAPGYTATYSAPPYAIRAANGARLLSGTWGAAVTSP